MLKGGVLPDGRAKRIRACGRPISLITRGGDCIDSRYRCRDRYCTDCAPRHARKAFACILSALESTDGEEVFAVTLTRRVVPGSAIDVEGDLREQIERDGRQWSATTARLRWDDSWRRIWRDTGKRAALKTLIQRGIEPRRVSVGPDSESTDSLYHPTKGWRGASTKTTYIWCREITRGSSGRVWHVHRHVICPDLVTAQRIISAYAMYQDDLQGDTPYRVDLRRWDSSAAAGYLASYLSDQRQKSGGWHSVARSLSAHDQYSWVAATKGLRRYDSAGEWRPLGIGKKADRSDTIIAISDSMGVYEPQEFFRYSTARLSAQEIEGIPASESTTKTGPCSGIEQTVQRPVIDKVDEELFRLILSLADGTNGNGWRVERHETTLRIQ